MVSSELQYRKYHNHFLAAQDDLWIGDRQAFVKCAADPKGPPGGDRGGRGGRGGRDRGGRQSFGGGDRKSFGGERKLLLLFIVISKIFIQVKKETTALPCSSKIFHSQLIRIVLALSSKMSRAFDCQQTEILVE